MMNSGYTKEYLQSSPPINFSLANAKKSDVTFTLYKNNICSEGTTVTERTIQTSGIDSSFPVIILLHGWSQYNANPWYKNYIEKYFRSKKCNIICVDWSPASTKTFLVSSANVKPIGEYIAEFLIASNIPPGNIHVISHSLGAHVAGFAGKMLYKKKRTLLYRITALDPAAPTIDNKYVSEAFRLSQNDAEFVDVYHTDAGFFGFTKPIGHVDFYANYGRNQPGCSDHSVDGYENHLRAIKYFEETINTQDFKAFPANISLNEYEYILDVNYEGQKVVFGDLMSTDSRGIFYFKTNECEPYLMKI